MNNTPQFNKAIEEVLAALTPHQMQCQQCGVNFDVAQEDIDFYKKIQVPPPTFCPGCRLQRRLGRRINMQPIFYKKKCSAPGHEEKIISFYSDNNPVKVYDNKYYASDQWDVAELNQGYDASKQFFPQFRELLLTVPQKCLQNDNNGEGCEHVISGAFSKNCYYVATPFYSENVYYAHLPVKSRDCVDVNEVQSCEKCFENVNTNSCYNCDFCYDSSNCIDSKFLFNCKNCQNCFGGSNLRNKQYYFFNQPLSKEEYEKKLADIDLGKASIVKQYKALFQNIFDKAIRRNVNNTRVENCIGDNIRDSKNCFYCFEVWGGSEDLKYAASIDGSRDSMDCFGEIRSSLVYDSTGIMDCSNVICSVFCKNGINIEYCLECYNCENCFGCSGLKNKKFCIFNKQYSQEDYFNIIDDIKTKMLSAEIYGNLFPLELSPFPYRDSNAFIEFPLSNDEIIKNKWHYEEAPENLNASQYNIVEAKDIPDDIKDVRDDILDKVIICEKTKKPFKIIKSELDFYRQKNIPLPIIHPLQRIRDRFAFRRPFKLWQYNCSKCGNSILSSYDPEKKYTVYCEDCYLKDIV